MKLKQYQKYKESNVDWIGKIPENWEIKKLKFCAQICNGQDQKEVLDEKGIYSILGTGGEFGKSMKYLYNKPSVLLGRKGTIDKPIYIEVPFWTVDTLFYTKINKNIHPKFFYYLATRINFKYYSDTTAVPSMTQEKLNGAPFAIPPKTEQKVIVNFLDKKTTEINQAIEKVEQLKELLKEKRLSLMGNVILDNNVPRIRLQFVVDNISRPISRKDKEVYSQLGLFNWARGIFHKNPTNGEDLGDSSFYFVEEGDLIISGQFAWEGAIAIAGPKENGCVVSHRFPIVKGKEEKLYTEFLWAFLTSKLGHFILNESSVGSAGRNRPLNMNRLMKEKMPVPSLKIQEEIIKIVKKEKKLNLLSKKFNKLMKEYKKSLINNVVTGKVDVRCT